AGREAWTPPCSVPRLAHRARDGVEEERPIVGLAVVVARHAEAEREDEDEERRGERPPGRLDERRVEGREVGPPLIVRPGPRRPRRVHREREQDGGRQ